MRGVGSGSSARRWLYGWLAATALAGCTDDDGDTQQTAAPTLTPTGDESSTGEGASTGEPTTTTPTTGPGGPRCGDGVEDPGEPCDDGNTDNSDACLNSCELAICSDGFVQTGAEACDDGNADNTDTCTNLCQEARCGDGFVQAGAEECDDGNSDDADACTNSCTAQTIVCGDGVVEGDEACDDGNADNSDNCLDTCVASSCGDGWQHAVFEECDDGNPDDTDDCVQCVLATCGDGFVHAGVEECDDADADETDECLSACTLATCGDGAVQEGVEVCDDGVNDGGYGGCLGDCSAIGPHCGDGVLEAGVETCDDGNAQAGDGCDAECQKELPPECKGYTELKEPDRAKSFNDGAGKVEKCDTNMGGKWFRLLAPAGTKLPTEPPTPFSCGTEAPGWMLGVYPTPEDGIVERKVCFNWEGDICSWEAPIQVLNCEDYFVFKLSNPPEVCLRYCGDA